MGQRASLGSIKLAVENDLDTLLTPGPSGLLPLHFGCHFRDAATVKYLVETCREALGVRDSRDQYPLHHACRGGNCDVINYLLGVEITGSSVRNTDGMLPIELMLFSSDSDNDSLTYHEAVFRLLKANPEFVPV